MTISFLSEPLGRDGVLWEDSSARRDGSAAAEGPALLATLAPDEFQSTLHLDVSFLRPVRPGRIVGRGRVVHRSGDLAYLEAALVDS
jgi:hypothetical protein